MQQQQQQRQEQTGQKSERLTSGARVKLLLFTSLFSHDSTFFPIPNQLLTRCRIVARRPITLFLLTPLSFRLDCKKTLTTWQDLWRRVFHLAQSLFCNRRIQKSPPRHAFSRLKGLDITETALPASCPSEAELPATRSNFSLSTTQNCLTSSAAFKRDHHLTRHRCLLRASRRIPIITPPVANIKHLNPLGKIESSHPRYTVDATNSQLHCLILTLYNSFPTSAHHVHVPSASGSPPEREPSERAP